MDMQAQADILPKVSQEALTLNHSLLNLRTSSKISALRKVKAGIIRLHKSRHTVIKTHPQMATKISSQMDILVCKPLLLQLLLKHADDIQDPALLTTTSNPHKTDPGHRLPPLNNLVQALLRVINFNTQIVRESARPC